MFAITTITHIISKNLVERLGPELKKMLVLFLLFSIIQGLQGQQASMAEEDVIAKAEKLFEAKNYQEALPLYAQLVSVHSGNPEYNYKFGVCTLYGNRVEHRRPIRYLENAAKSMGNDPQLNFHLGIAYYQNQEFANAMKYFNLYLAKLAPNSPERPKILEKVNCCLNGLSLEHVNLVNEIVSTSEFQKDNFHRAYRADELDGMLILKPDAFVSAKEKTNGENSFVYISEPRGTLIYSGYENSSSDQRDLFKVQMTENGEWGKPEKVSETINSMFDEAYPVLTDNGTSLYFCSKGHNSIGGYDIFKSTYDTANNTFSSPENLGIGVNSPFDDILFIPDKTSQFAYFASDRDNLNESINVYKVQVVENAFGNDQVLANNDFGSKLNIPENTQNETGEKSTNVEPEQTKETILLASNQEKELSPSEKAQKMVHEKSLSNNMVDSAFLLVAETKSLIRSLTNKRDRANSISESKSEAAKNLEVSFDEVVSNLALITNETEFENELQKAIEIRDEIFQYRYRSDHANLIAWNIGKQIKIKDAELEILKQHAGGVQSASIGNDFSETQNNYGEFINYYAVADTLTDYNNLIVSLTNDEIFAKTPATELAFAEELRQGFKTNTLLAMTQKQQQQVSKDPIPINVVDNRTSAIATNTICPAKLVETVEYEESSSLVSINTEEENIEINFNIDAIEAIKQVETILFAGASTKLIIEEDLEVNFHADMVKASQLVEAIYFEGPSFAYLQDDEELEIRYFSDQIQPEGLILPVAFNEIAYATDIAEEQLEINFRMDMVAPENVIIPINFDELAYELEMAYEEVEINFTADQVEAIELIKPVSFDELAYNVEIDEDIDINTGIDKAEALKLVETIHYNNLVANIEIDENELEITSNIDFIKIEGLIEQINFNEESYALQIEDSPEIRFDIDQVDALPIVGQIAFEDNIFDLMAETELEINLEKDVEIIPAIEPILIAENKVMQLTIEEDLDIDSEIDQVEALVLVQPIYATNLALNPEIDSEEIEINIDEIQPIEYTIIENDNFLTEENLDINLSIEQIEAYKLVEPIEFTFNDFGNLTIEDDIEVHFTNDAIDATRLVEPVYINELAINSEFESEELEINFNADSSGEAYKLVKPVYAIFSPVLFPEDEELETRLSNDHQISTPVIAQVQSISFVEEPANMIEMLESEVVINFDVDKSEETLFADNTPVRLETKNISQIPSIKSELFYLRESMSIATGIETSRTDFEILNIALSSPFDLSYEELLFAASLAQDPNDKLYIYNQAFIHISRDWRAFNNAAVIAMTNSDLEMAEVFLYQASLISENNGKIENNMGILACYKNDFEQAEDHFLAANEMGVNSEYNLQLMKSLYTSDNSKTADLKQEMGESKYYEMLGDIINYGTKK